MRLAFVSVPRFPCAVEVSRSPRLAAELLIVGDAEQPKRVLECSAGVARYGVHSGMTLRKALGLCPAALVIPPDPVLYGSRWEAIVSAFAGITPEVEDEEPGLAYLNLTGLQAHYREEQELGSEIIGAVRAAGGLTASVGVSSGKLPAFAAATSAAAGQVCVIPDGEEASFLAGMSIDLLPVDPDTVFRLHLFGLDTLGDVAKLTVPELQSQFGSEGQRLWQLANGLDNAPLLPRPQRETIAATFFFETPVAGIDVMLAVAKQLLSRLRPSLRGRAIREVTLQAELASGRGWERRLVLREAVSEDARLLFVLRSVLNNFPPPQAVRSLSLRLEGLAGETGKQLALGDHSRQQRQLEEAIRQLKARYGYSPVYRCVEVEPWSVVPEERQILVESDA